MEKGREGLRRGEIYWEGGRDEWGESRGKELDSIYKSLIFLSNP